MVAGSPVLEKPLGAKVTSSYFTASRAYAGGS
jgi:hypothetical protein